MKKTEVKKITDLLNDNGYDCTIIDEDNCILLSKVVNELLELHSMSIEDSIEHNLKVIEELIMYNENSALFYRELLELLRK